MWGKAEELLTHPDVILEGMELLKDTGRREGYRKERDGIEKLARHRGEVERRLELAEQTELDSR